MDEGTSAIAGRVSGATNKVFLPQKRPLSKADWYKKSAKRFSVKKLKGK
ncbi:hypothetical protein PP2015_1640 [Pseudoalteromonas phenolica]|uniref:Uncharacterized protein n=1 Tax=Pseudoalteromonas phenolica TaxID=161398 RepID=A0A0S2K256_9GAMM|nr:hypothetical protein PP2015_1640 [Pseudoalteromonas phenolica]